MSFFIAWPWLALVPAIVFFWLYRGTRVSRVAATAVAWAAYAAYEFAMQRRWLCSGECNIRVDLLLLYPVLLILSLTAVVALMRARRPNRPNPSR